MLSEFDRKELMVRESQVDDLKKKLKKCEQDQARQKKARDTRKKKLESLDEESRVLLTGKKDCTPGRPPKEDNNAMIDAICRIAISGSAAHEKRRSDIIRTVKTLDQLTSALKLEGFTLQRSSVYLRLLPRIARTIEGKRYVNTAPVKLLRSQNSLHKGHPSTRFAKSTIRHLEELAGILGPEEVCFLSQDDKCKVPIGLTAANKQAPLLMHLEYQVTLPDHDYVIAANHKLIPSVFGGMEIKKNCFTSEAVTYSGPTYIAIRSAKHSGSNAYHHLHDLKKIRMIPEFEPLLYCNGIQKPVFIITVDGGPDENPRYEKTIACAEDLFCSSDLDALFLATNAPGRSAFNRIERRMAPLSRELAGVILPHETFGTHLNSKGGTIDPELEKKNFAHAGEILAEIWSNTVIDGKSTISEFIDLPAPQEIQKKNEEWLCQHVRQGQYCLQIVKCGKEKCCTSFRSSILKVLSSRFLPPLSRWRRLRMV